MRCKYRKGNYSYHGDWWRLEISDDQDPTFMVAGSLDSIDPQAQKLLEIIYPAFGPHVSQATEYLVQSVSVRGKKTTADDWYPRSIYFPEGGSKFRISFEKNDEAYDVWVVQFERKESEQSFLPVSFSEEAL